jgi:multiple sugar transport system permease protein
MGMKVKSFSQTQKRFAYTLTLPIVIVLLGLLIFPLIFSVYISTQSSLEGLDELKFVGLRNYQEAFTNSIFRHSVYITFIFVIISVGLTTVLGFFVAHLLNGIDRGVGIFRTIYMLPLAITPVIVGLTFGMMFNPLFGVINYLMGLIHIPPLGWATEIETALLTVIIIDTWQWTPFMIIILYAGLQMLPVETYEAAKLDGASWFQEIKFITIPLLKPILMIAIIFRFMDAFRSFDIIYVVTHGGPGHATETMVMRAYLESLKYFRLEMGAVIGIILLILTFTGTKYALKVMPK